MTPPRLPRFKRVSSIRAIELTDRDCEIPRQMYRHNSSNRPTLSSLRKLRDHFGQGVNTFLNEHPNG